MPTRLGICRRLRSGHVADASAGRPDDYVVATGEAHSVREFVELAFSLAGLGWQEFVEIDPRYFRATEVDFLHGNPSKARKVLGWRPRVGFEELVKMMVENDLELAQQELALRAAGHSVVQRGASATP